jgi:uncharacterized membrane protein
VPQIRATFIVIISAFVGCTGGGTGLGTDHGDSGATNVGGGSGTSDPSSSGAGGSLGGIPTTSLGIPCAVQTVLQTRCQGCHSSPPVNGAPMSLMTLADLRNPARSNPMLTVAAMASMRMNNAATPMPPRGAVPATAAEIKIVTDWVAGSAPVGIICGAPPITGAGGSGTVGPARGLGGASGTAGAGGAAGTVTAGGIPCDIQALLQSRCQGCHSNPPMNGAPMSLVSYANLTAASVADPAMSFAQRALARMQNTVAPMPPAPNARATAAEIASMSAWVATAYPKGTCGVAAGTGGASGAGTGGRTGSGGAVGTGAGGSTGTVATGVPCDVQAVLQARCLGCHSNPPVNNAPMSLASYTNLTAQSFADPTMTFAQRALARMQNTAAPMPPAPSVRASASDIATISAWVASMYPRGTCGGATGSGGAPGTGGRGGASGAGGTTGAGGGGAVVGMPCDVQAVFTAHCTTCHAATPNSGAPMPLVTRTNLTTASIANAAQTFAQRAVMRMQGNPTQMPPAPGTRPSATEITTVNNWIAAGYPVGTCDTTISPPPPDPFKAAPKCTSGITWNSSSEGSPIMNPGLSCLGCHTGGGGGGGDDSGGGNSGPGGGNSGPGGGGDDNGGGGGDDNEGAALYTIAGTVYPTAHEPNLCYGANGTNGAKVVITDAANRTITLTPNQSGNFFYAGAVTFPFRAKVTFQGRERIMTTAQSNGSCNGCHTQNGASGAPGRILLP